MQCMKCGKEAGQSQVFCDECLAVMEKYPVKPDTAVQLPQRKPRNTEKKPPRKKEPSVEELQKQHRKVIRWMMGTIFVLTVIVLLLAGLLYEAYGGTIPFWS